MVTYMHHIKIATATNTNCTTIGYTSVNILCYEIVADPQ